MAPLPSSKNNLENTGICPVEERTLLTSNCRVVFLLLYSKDRKTVHFSVGEGTAKLITDRDGRNTDK